MIVVPEIRMGPLVNGYISDEIHITNKAKKAPIAVLSFVAVDSAGAVVEGASVLTVSLSGPSFDRWYKSWDGEEALYSEVLLLLQSEETGTKASGLDGLRSEPENFTTSEAAQEVLNEATQEVLHEPIANADQ